MFNLGGGELLVILVVALLVLGPEKLPRFMRTVGKAVGDLRRASTDFQRTMNLELAEKDAAAEKKTPEPAVSEAEPATTHEPEERTNSVDETIVSDTPPRLKARLRAVPPRRTPRRGTRG